MARTVCAKVPDEMKAEIDRTEINVSAVVRAALDDELIGSVTNLYPSVEQR